MKHINTKSEMEKNAKEEFGNKTPSGMIEATDEIRSAVESLSRNTVEIDRLQLECSELRGKIMRYMGDKEQLNVDGMPAATWTRGKTTSKIDYESIFKLYKVTDEDIKKHTTTSVSSRSFSLA